MAIFFRIWYDGVETFARQGKSAFGERVRKDQLSDPRFQGMKYRHSDADLPDGKVQKGFLLTYADIIVDISHERLDKSFQYEVPDALIGKIRPGSVVRIPFGKGKKDRIGYVLELSEHPKIDPERIRPIHGLDAQHFDLPSRQIALAAWMKKRYGSTMVQALRTVMPVQVRKKNKIRETLVRAVDGPEAEKWMAIFLAKNQRNRARLMEALIHNPRLLKSEATKKLRISPETFRFFLEKKLIEAEDQRIYRNPPELREAGLFEGRLLISGTDKGLLRGNDAQEKDAQGNGLQGKEEREKLSLTEEQETCVRGIWQEYQSENRPCLLQGVTGSGKTHVYMELIDRILREGKEVIYLIPEISLTWQSVQRLYARFGRKLAIIHSRMNPSERSDSFERMRAGDARVAVGPRSALFAPFSNLGLILIDEEHEESYKSGQTPRYDTRETAVERAKMEGALLVMGSATPSVETFYAARNGRFAHFRLKNRYHRAVLPQVSIVDMRRELTGGNRRIFSRELLKDMEERLQKNEQIMLFLNRRGYSGFLSCVSCGKPVLCPHCDISLTLHKDGRMICHYCGYETPRISKCPSCGSPYIRGFHTGTEQVESLLHKHFPSARVLRMDKDTTRHREDYSDILKSFAAHQADILVGTQMIVKGHDFPDVSLVGVLAADISLYAGTYRSAERTYQLLVQAIGRAGRRNTRGKAVIQTWNPENYSIQAAAVQNYDAFYKEESAGRALMHYPPFGGMITVHASSLNRKKLHMAQKAIRSFLLTYGGDRLVILGPVPAAITKIRDYYQEVLYIKGEDYHHLWQIREYLEQYIEMNKGFAEVSFQFDWNRD